MRMLVMTGNWLRVVLGLALPAALVATGGGAALAAARPAAPSCTVSWVGRASDPLWTIGKNWSTGQVPGPSSDVCITKAGADVLTRVSISVHSLRAGAGAAVVLQGTRSRPLTARFATFADLSSARSLLSLRDATVDAAQVRNAGGTIFAEGTCALVSPDIAFGPAASVHAANGKLTLTSLRQLSHGTLSGAAFDTSGAVVVLPGDITRLASANLAVGPGSAIVDAAGRNALAGLTSIDSQSSLLLDNDLLVTGNLVADGRVSLGAGTLAVDGTYTQAGGGLSVVGNTTLRASQVLIDRGASLGAEQGTIAGSLVSHGSVQVGPAVTHVTGSYTQDPNASLSTLLGASLAVAGQATVSGPVSVFQSRPAVGATSPVITAGSLMGGFTSHNLGIDLVIRQGEIDAVIDPQIAVADTTVAPGGQVTVNGASCGFATMVKVFLDRTSGTPLASGLARSRGAFAMPVAIPASATAGSHELIAVGADGRVAEATITVT
jgi:hypothetical protein